MFKLLTGVEETFVRMFRKLDTKDFKMDTLKDLLQKTLKIAPRQQAPLKVEVLLKSQGFALMYRHIDEQDIGNLMQGKALGEMVARGLKLTRNMVLLGGSHVSWRANDNGIPVGIGMNNPGWLQHKLGYGSASEPGKIGRSIEAHLDASLQVVTYMVAYNPLGASQGVVKHRSSRIHLPIKAALGFSPADSQAEIELDVPTDEEPLSYMFSSQTAAFMWGFEDSKAMAYLKDTCAGCEKQMLVTRGEEYQKGKLYFLLIRKSHFLYNFLFNLQVKLFAKTPTPFSAWNHTLRSTNAKLTLARLPLPRLCSSRSSLPKSTRTVLLPVSSPWASCRCATTSTTTLPLALAT